MFKYLPEGYQKACWDTKAMSRKKGITNEDTLLTLCLYYAYDSTLLDTSIYAKFKNYFRYYKNIELLYKESTSSINTTFQSTVNNFLENSEIIITADELNNIVCDLIIIKNNEKKNFKEIYEIKEMVFVNYKNDIKNGKKFSKFFEIIDNIKKLIEKLNILYNNGYPYHKDFHFKIEEGNLVSNENNTFINLSEIINNINDLNNSFKKTQIF